MISPKAVDTGNAGWNHVRCLCQQLILVARTIGNFHVTVEQEPWCHQNARSVIFY
jgi:hypothetical protein